MSLWSLSLSLCKFSLKRLYFRVTVIAKTGFYIKIKVKSFLIFFTIVILSIAVTALKIRYILIYFLVPFALYIIYKLISRFTIYKVLFALIAVLIIRGVISSVKGVVLSVNIK